MCLGTTRKTKGIQKYNVQIDQKLKNKTALFLGTLTENVICYFLSSQHLQLFVKPKSNSPCPT